MLEVKSFRTAAYEEIKDKIIKGEYGAGQALNERALSEEFGISRTPIREALQQLSFEGWIVNEPYKKNVVREFKLKDIIEAQKVRSALEILAIEEAFTHLTKEDLDYAQSLVELQKQQTTYSEVIRIDRIFHEFFYEKSGNIFLISLMDNINDIVRYFGILALTTPGRSLETIHEHEEIIAALRAGSLEKITKAMKDHMTYTTDAIMKQFQKTHK